MATKIPSQLMDFRAYNESERLFGTGNEVTLPDIVNIANEIELPSGKMEVPSLRTENLEFELPFLLFDEEAADVSDPSEVHTIILRGSTQKVKTADYNFEYGGIKVTIKGFTKEVKLGKLTRSDKMDSVVKMTIAFIEILDTKANKELLYLDKLNDEYRVNGKDVRAGINQYL